jgi:hypothetical protein
MKGRLVRRSLLTVAAAVIEWWTVRDSNLVYPSAQ